MMNPVFTTPGTVRQPHTGVSMGDATSATRRAMSRARPLAAAAKRAAGRTSSPSSTGQSDQTASDATDDEAMEGGAPACVMTFNASDASGAGGIAGDVSTIAAMGGHPLPVVTAIVLRDSAEVFEQHPIDDEIVTEQARSVLEDIHVAGLKVGFLGSAEGVSAVAEIVSDYAELPLVSYWNTPSWLDDASAQAYGDAFRELILPATEVLVGNHKALTDFLLPDWDNERGPSARELAVAAGQHGTRYVLVTGVSLPSKGKQPPWVDNVLASPQGAMAGEKFERFETSFVGAGDTLSASLAALLAAGAELQAAVSEALQFLDEALDAGFQPGMGHVVPDRFFWALPAPDEDQVGSETEPGPDDSGDQGSPSRRVH